MLPSISYRFRRRTKCVPNKEATEDIAMYESCQCSLTHTPYLILLSHLAAFPWRIVRRMERLSNRAQRTGLSIDLCIVVVKSWFKPCTCICLYVGS